MTNQVVTINSRKFDGKIHRSWKAELLSNTDSLVTLVGIFEEEVRHPKLGVIRRGTISYEYYWYNEWFNVFRFHEPGGELRNFYCNLNQPPVFRDGVLDYVDLDIDVLVSADFNVEILDLDEFEENAALFGYSADLRSKIFDSLDEILKLIESRGFPFS